MSVQYGTFLKSLLDNPKLFNTLLPISNRLANTIASMIPFQRNDQIIELSPGHGVITRHLLAKMAHKENYLALEQEACYYDSLRENYPFAAFEYEALEDINVALKRSNWKEAKYQLLSRSLTSLSMNETKNMVNALKNSSSTDGEFIGFQYLHSYKFDHATALRATIEKDFGPLQETRLVIGNLPPVFLFRWKKRGIEEIPSNNEQDSNVESEKHITVYDAEDLKPVDYSCEPKCIDTNKDAKDTTTTDQR